MRIALTGVPGVGKRAAAKALRKKGYRVIDLSRVAVQHGFIKGYDKARACKIIDLKRLGSWLEQKIEGREIFLEGHFSHLLKNELTIVLRCEPKELEKRLKKRGYSKKKILENLEAEALGVITAEALQRNKNIYEIDTTELEIKKIVNGIINIKRGRFKNYLPGRINWSKEIIEWY